MTACQMYSRVELQALVTLTSFTAEETDLGDVI